MSAFDEFVQTAFLATDTRPDVFHSAFVSLLRPIRIGKQRTTEHDHVAFAVAESFFRKVGITEFAYRNDRNRKSAVCFDVVFGKVFLTISAMSKKHPEGMEEGGCGNHQLS